jgi:hypothetical protein
LRPRNSVGICCAEAILAIRRKKERIMVCFIIVCIID